jgi:hypothetical protein
MKSARSANLAVASSTSTVANNSSYEEPKGLGKLPKFTGTNSEDIDEWLEDFEAKVNRTSCSEADRIITLRSQLSGTARTVFSGLSEQTKTSYASVVAALRKTFSKDCPLDWLAELRETKIERGEDYRLFASRVNKITKRAHPFANQETLELTTIDHFIRGLSKEQGELIIAHKPKTLDEAIRMAYTYEKYPHAKNAERKRKNNLLLLESDESEPLPKRNGGVQDVNLCTIMQQVNNNNKQVTSMIKREFESLRQSNSQPSNSQNHNNHYNYKYNKNNRQQPYQRPESTGKSDYNNRSQVPSKKCYLCGASNHLKASCPNRRRDFANRSGNYSQENHLN